MQTENTDKKKRSDEDIRSMDAELSEFYINLFGEDISLVNFDVSDSEVDAYRRNGIGHKKLIPEYGCIDLEEKRYELDRDGAIIKRFASVKDIPNDYFRCPEFSILLPPFCERVINVIRCAAKPILLKRRVADRMIDKHGGEMAASKIVLETAIYCADTALYNRPKARPTYYVFARRKRDFMLATIDTDPANKYFEIVDWRKVGREKIDAMMNMTPLNGGRIYTL